MHPCDLALLSMTMAPGPSPSWASKLDDAMPSSGADFYVPPSNAPGAGTQALTRDQWGAIGTSPRVGDFTNIEGLNPQGSLSRVPQNWTINMQNDNKGVLFTNPMPDGINPSEFRIKAGNPAFEPGYQDYAIGRVGTLSPGNPDADKYRMVYSDNTGAIVPRSDPNWNRKVHFRLPFKSYRAE